MSNLVPDRPKIYYITPVDNLKSIANDKHLLSDRIIRARGDEVREIGMRHIKDRRLKVNRLRTCTELFVGDCVPFYFCPRSVMLFIIHKSNLQELTYSGGEKNIVHLEFDLHSVIEWAEAAEKHWEFTNFNAGSSYYEGYNNIDDLNKLNWRVILSNNWQGEKEAKQSEFLIESKCPFSLVERIGVIDSNIKTKVEEILGDTHNNPNVIIEPQWYYT